GGPRISSRARRRPAHALDCQHAPARSSLAQGPRPALRAQPLDGGREPTRDRERRPGGRLDPPRRAHPPRPDRCQAPGGTRVDAERLRDAIPGRGRAGGRESERAHRRRRSRSVHRHPAPSRRPVPGDEGGRASAGGTVITPETLEAQEAAFARAFAAADLAGVRERYDPAVVYLSPTVRLFDWPRRIEGIERTTEFISLTIRPCRSTPYNAAQRVIAPAVDG